MPTEITDEQLSQIGSIIPKLNRTLAAAPPVKPRPLVRPTPNQQSPQTEMDSEMIRSARDFLGDSSLPNVKSAMVQAGLRLMSLGSRMSGDSRSAAEHSRHGRITEEVTNTEAAPGWWKRQARGAMTSLITSAPASALGGPAGAIGLSSAMAGNEGLVIADEKGLTGAKKYSYASVKAAIEGVTTAYFQKLGMGGAESLLAGQSVGNGLRAGLTSLGKSLKDEAREELAITLMDSLTDKLFGVDPKATDPDKLGSALADTVAQTVMVVGAAGTPSVIHGAMTSPDAKATEQQPVAAAAPLETAPASDAQPTAPAPTADQAQTISTDTIRRLNAIMPKPSSMTSAETTTSTTATPPKPKPRDLIASPEAMSEFVAQNPSVAEAVARIQVPSRTNLEVAGIDAADSTSAERKKLVGQVRRARGNQPPNESANANGTPSVALDANQPETAHESPEAIGTRQRLANASVDGAVPAEGVQANTKPGIDASNIDTQTTQSNESPIRGFTRSKGSTYELHGDGTTTRNKAARDDFDHKGDSGAKERSQKTVYIPEEAATHIGMWQTSSATGKRIVVEGDQVTLISNNAKTGQPGIDGRYKLSTAPEVGLHPLELWKPDARGWYRGNHPGSAITAVDQATDAESLDFDDEAAVAKWEGQLSAALSSNNMDAAAELVRQLPTWHGRWGRSLAARLVLERTHRPDLNYLKTADGSPLWQWRQTLLSDGTIPKPTQQQVQQPAAPQAIGAEPSVIIPGESPEAQPEQAPRLPTITRSSIAAALPGQGVVEAEPGVFRVEFKNGSRLTITNKPFDGPVDRRNAEASVGRPLTDDEFARFQTLAAFRVSDEAGREVDGFGAIYIGQNAAIGKLEHELIHGAFAANLLTPQESRSLVRETSPESLAETKEDAERIINERNARVGAPAVKVDDEFFARIRSQAYAEERIASAYQKWSAKRRIKFVDRLKALWNEFLSRLGILDPTADNAFSRIASGEIWGRPAQPENRRQAAARLSGEVRYSGAVAGPVWRDNILDALDSWQPKGTPAQLRAHIAKTRGAADEARWIGLDDFLRGKKSVTNAEVANFVRTNSVSISEVIKGGEKPNIEWVSRYNNTWLSPDQVEPGEYQLVLDGERSHAFYTVGDDGRVVENYLGEKKDYPSVEAAHAAAVERSSLAYDGTKYANYQTPGGKSYRELLLTLPPKPYAGEIHKDKYQSYGRDVWYYETDNGTESVVVPAGTDEAGARQRIADAQSREDGEHYQTPHFIEQNVLAHVRFNERTDADNKRVLFVEEVQSDWHQQGRRGGYRGDVKPESFTNPEKQNRQSDGRDVWSFEVDGERRLGYGNTEQEAREQLAGVLNKSGNKVPDAPFKQTWPMLVMKRMLRYAAENGFDRIAWTTGEQQAARYDLSKQVNDITLHGTGDNLRVSASDVNNRQVIDMQHTTRDGLADIVGKEAAEKLLAQPEPDPNNPYAARALIGVDLKLGGEGMQSFYDRLLPTEVGKFVKKWGGKVGTTDIGQEVRNELDLSSLGEPKPEDDSTRFETRATVHSVDITPEMRASVVTEGVPLYAGSVGNNPNAPQVYELRKPERLSNLYDKAGGLLRWLFTSRGDLPQAAYAANEQMRNFIATHEEQMRQAVRDFRRAAKKTYGAIPQLGDAQHAALDNAMRGGSLNAIPPAMRAPVRAMREHVDNLSRKLVESGAIYGKLALTFEKNLGTYLTRSYRVFSDPKWAEKVPLEIRNRFETWLAAQFPELTPQQVAQRTNELLYGGTAAESPMALLNNSKLGSKILDIIKRRKNVPPELRGLWGEESNPLVNYSMSISKMARLFAAHRFLMEVRDSGLGRWLFDQDDPNIDPDARAVLAVNDSDVMAPLNGLRTYPEIKAAFDRQFSPRTIPQWYRAYLRLNGIIKLAKTGGSLIGQVRNNVGNWGLHVRNGNWRINKAGEALKATATKLEALGLRTPDDWRKFHLKMTDLGVINQGVPISELKAIMGDVFDDSYFTRTENALIGAIKGTAQAAAEVYQFQDDFHRAYSWFNEREKYRKAYPEWSDEHLDRYAAEIVNDTMPTYSRIPAGVQALRRAPVGNFYSWQAEIVRTTLKTAQLTVAELKNPRTRAIGAERLAGTAALLSLPAAVAAYNALMIGMTPEENEDRRRFLPPWSKNSDIVWHDDNTYTDLTYSDPMAYLRKPYYAALRGDDLTDSVIDSVMELVDPFFNEQFLAERLTDVTLRGGQSKDGREIYNPQDASTHKAAAIFKHIAEPFVPLVAGQAAEAYRSYTGVPDASGKTLDPAVTLAQLFTGARVSHFSAEKSLRYRIIEHAQSLRDASRILVSAAASRSEVPLSDISSAYVRADEARKRLFDVLREDVNAAMRLGLSEDDVFEMLDKHGLSKDYAKSVISGEYEHYRPSDASRTTIESAPDGGARLIAIDDAWIAAHDDKQAAAERLRVQRQRRLLVLDKELAEKPKMTMKPNETHDEFRARYEEVRERRQRQRAEYEMLLRTLNEPVEASAK